MQRYRSGHNGADSKSVCAKAHEGSNPSLCAKTKSRLSAAFCFAKIRRFALTSLRLGDIIKAAADAAAFSESCLTEF